MPRSNVSPRVAHAVLFRDKYCQGQRIEAHQCRTTMGIAHGARDVRLLTMEHVAEVGKTTMAKKAPSDAQHLLAVCGWWNLEMAQSHKDEERALLAKHLTP